MRVTALLLVAAVTVVSCGKEGGLSRALSKLNYDSLPAKAPRPTKPAEKLHATVTELRRLLAVQSQRALSRDQAVKARAARAEIGTQLRALDKQFASDRTKLLKLGSAHALDRLDKIRRRTDRLAHSLQGTLTEVPQTGARAPAAAASATKLLTALSPEQPQQPLSSELGFGVRNARPQPLSLSAGITPAYNSPGGNEAPSDLPRDPQPADLNTSGETRVTPAIHDIARELGGDPIRIYQYVHNNIRYEPYYGVRKGADETLAGKAGSDADQAALLIALLRDSGIHARFVHGAAELPTVKAANWLGVDLGKGERRDAVPEILANGGIPTSQVRANGQLTKVRFDHIWAEAYVSKDAYRGTEEGLGGKAWLPVDPSIKQTTFKRPNTHALDVLKPVVDRWVGEVKDTTEPVPGGGWLGSPTLATNARTEQLVQDAQHALKSTGLDDGTTLADVIGDRSVAVHDDTYLPSSTPFRALEVAAELRSVPGSMTASVAVSVAGSDPLSLPDPNDDGATSDGVSYTASTPEFAGKRMTLAYVPATSDDAAIIDAYHGLLNGPSYGAALIPVLRVGGAVVGRGHTAVSTGYTQRLTIKYHTPGFATSVVENPVAVGSISALSLDLGDVDPDRLAERGSRLHDQIEATPDEPVLTDSRIGELFSQLGDLYFLTNDEFNGVIGQSMGVATQRQLSGAIVATDVSVSYVAGFPVGTRLTGASVDVDQDVLSATARGTLPGAVERFGVGSAAYASSTEAGVLGATFGTEAVSTTKVIQKAVANQVPVYFVDRSNLNDALGRITVPDAARSEIRTAVTDRNASVMVPEHPITLGGWTGTAYVIQDGTRSAYQIQGGTSGGKTLIPIEQLAARSQRAAEEAAEKAKACKELPKHLAIFAESTISLVVHLALALATPFPGNILFLALWVPQLVFWLIEWYMLVDLYFECTSPTPEI